MEQSGAPPNPNDSEAERLRQCLKTIRDLATLPNDVLINGKTAAQTAHEYVMAGKQKRGVYKQIRLQTKRRNRRNKGALEKPPNSKP